MAIRTVIRSCSLRIALCVAAASSLGCGGSVQPQEMDSSGTATFRWTIDEGFDPGLCDHYGAVSVDIDVYSRRGEYLERIAKPCTAFSTAASLSEGGYAARLQLVGVDGSAVSTPLATSFDVQQGHAVDVDTDFAKLCFPAGPEAASFNGGHAVWGSGQPLPHH